MEGTGVLDFHESPGVSGHLARVRLNSGIGLDSSIIRHGGVVGNRRVGLDGGVCLSGGIYRLARVHLDGSVYLKGSVHLDGGVSGGSRGRLASGDGEAKEGEENVLEGSHTEAGR